MHHLIALMKPHAPIRCTLPLALAAVALAAGGCEKKQAALPPLPGEGPTYNDQTFVASNDGETSVAVAAPDSDAPPTSALTVDAMVGQINGRPVYASSIFREIGEESLVNRGKQLPRGRFAREVQQDLSGVISAKLTNMLVLAEAEAELSPQQQAGLFQVLRKEREKLIAELGGGSIASAEATLQSRGYSGLDERIEERRQELLVQKYLSEKLYPKVYVTRKMVERYYRNNLDQFVKPGKVVLRIILVRTEELAKQVDDELASGTGFDTVAEKYTSFRRSQGGRVEFTDRLETFDALADEVDEPIRQLTEGSHTGRIDRYTPAGRQFWWVKLDSYEPGESQSLTDAYLKIERVVRNQQFARLNQQYTRDLLRKGNYTSPDVMVGALMDVALNRYAQSR